MIVICRGRKVLYYTQKGTSSAGLDDCAAMRPVQVNKGLRDKTDARAATRCFGHHAMPWEERRVKAASTFLSHPCAKNVRAQCEQVHRRSRVERTELVPS